MSDLHDIAERVDAAVAAVGDVLHVYAATPPVRSLAAAIAGRGGRAHVRERPTRRIDVAIGVDAGTESKGVAARVARAVRSALPDDWANAEVEVQVRRVARAQEP